MAVRLIRQKRPKHQAAARLTWYLSRVRLLPPAPLGKERSRDAKADPYLSASLSAQAQYLVTYDRDILVPEKPFGIEVIRPGEFLRRLPG